MNSQTDRLNTALAGRYRIERALGAGGMATVFLAEDLKHKRKVALKVLKPELAAVLGAERFVQEITTTASLQHPHILPLFDSGTADGFLYYVMPFIQGETLRDKLNRETQLGVGEAVKIATDVADALHYAHTQGVIHRDIKPENILLANGRPMVADFGIALAVSAAAGGRMTETGLSLGTPHYMSPEQATADKEITGRSDIYSLASVLYEMLAGVPPHEGGSAQQTIMRIIAEAPRPVSELRKSVPPNVAAAIAKALEKLPADRFASAAEFSEALRNPAFALGATRTAATATSRSQRLLVPALAASTVALGIVAIWAFARGQPTPAQPTVRFTIPVPTGIIMLEDESHNLAISPDGRTLVYATAGRLYRRRLDQDSAVALPATEGASGPFFAPDGQSIAFTQGDAIQRMSIDGGPLARVTSGSFFGATWTEDGSIISTTRGALWRTPASGGASKQLTTVAPGESEHAWPQAVDGSRVLIYTVLGNTGLTTDAKVVAMNLDTERRVLVREQASHGRFIPPDRVAYLDATGTISVIGFDVDRMMTVGEPVPALTGVEFGWYGGGASFALSRTGTLAYVRGSTFRSYLAWWVDRTGRRSRLGDPMSPATFSLARDGRRILTDPPSPSALEIWLMDGATGARDRVTLARPGTVSYESPIWSPDGKRFATAYQVADSMRIELRAIEGSDTKILTTMHHHRHLQDWHGQWLLITDEHPERSSDLVAVRIDSVQHQIVIAATPAAEWTGRFSPDGRWIAFQSDESGRYEVYVTSFPATDVRRQVSTNGGRWPRWSQMSGELFYWQDSTLMTTRVSTAGVFQRDMPRPLFTMVDAEPSYARWDVTADGQRFLIATRNPESLAREINVVLGWNAAVRSLERR